ncbi:hypothetical protein K3172_08270 [Qipengyuania sp. 6B39]|uniref:hypothetical protein n=1 Tax=Qipengyuania proteolytica TaxID=2867239 RepID=UPI001C8AA61F|nr:hypothetical protein [Qipengyuania proteolytica]MBX7495850.1 hypothetical protein [Qipengyuania proteolytica]
MKAGWLIGGAALALSSSLVLAQSAPEDLLPPGFDNPAPAPSPTQAAPAPSATGAPAPNAAGEIVQPLPSGEQPAPTSGGFDLANLPTLREIENMSTDELDELLGLKPKFDIPPAARRSMERAGVLAASEGGLPAKSLAKQPAALVRAALAGTKAPMVSRWGHILLRRTLASRLAAPEGMDPVEFATLRVRALNAMGEHAVARALVQDIDTANYSPELTNAAIDAYIGTADIVGACPAVRLVRTGRDDVEWQMLAGICNAYAGEETRALNDLRRLQSRGQGEPIDVLLAQRFAGAAGSGRRAVTIEWDDVDSVTPWRFAMANALGEPLPENLSDDLGPDLLKSAALTPALGPLERVGHADVAGQSGIYSSAAMVDLYSQIFADGADDSDASLRASRLREAYVGTDPASRLAAIRDVWGGAGDYVYGRMVMTAFAAARLPADEAFASDAGELIASMLAAGLDRDALRWAGVVDEGSLGWALLALAAPTRQEAVTDGELDSFVDDDTSSGQRKSRMLLAGLAGLDRVGQGDIAEYSQRLSVSLGGETRWTRAIDAAADVGNPTLVAMLAGLGMQGDSWDRMTARHLFHIVSALRRVGLEAEARMIAAEAVARA